MDWGGEVCGGVLWRGAGIRWDAHTPQQPSGGTQTISLPQPSPLLHSLWLTALPRPCSSHLPISPQGSRLAGRADRYEDLGIGLLENFEV